MLGIYKTRKRLFRLVGDDDSANIIETVYSTLVMAVIILSLVPLMFPPDDMPKIFDTLSTPVIAIFVIDYAIRWITSDFILKKGWKSFFIYPFTTTALIDFFSLLPFFFDLSNGFKALKLLRFTRLIKITKYSPNAQRIAKVFQKEKKMLMSIFGFALFFIFVSALLLFQIEHAAQPENFKTFFDALWWAFATLSTVGYGDIYPITDLGRVISMCVSALGLGIIALPSGVITAAFLEEFKYNQGETNIDSEKDETESTDE